MLQCREIFYSETKHGLLDASTGAAIMQQRWLLSGGWKAQNRPMNQTMQSIEAHEENTTSHPF